MPLVILPNNKVIHGGPSIITSSIKNHDFIKHAPVHLEATYDTFIKPNNPAFHPLIPFQMISQQNHYNQPPVKDIIHFNGNEIGLPLNPIKKTNNINNISP